ncbi:serine hydrolase domain-containing protein [Nakamurella endophytica]|uniref:1,4-butanediol diacrylate esterase n=1 Tax=Nakamurella endophytica TaxID=1748367 RepID=A0A917STF7_9ACTN|nr:serine hydrolase domain-containing protein [Nakamurella endophytica]GGL94712.1 1,4-butanediol diacrylate esterase [Nakamurella endophytica]
MTSAGRARSAPWQDGLDELLASAVERGAVPGAVAVVADADSVLYLRAVGVADGRTGRPLATDAVFRIASQTKLATALLALTLVEDGVLDLAAPVRDVLPEFGSRGVLTGFAGRAPVLEQTRRTATVRDLLTHTSGLGYDTWHPGLRRFHETNRLPGLGSGLRHCLDAPLVAQPTESFHYGTSMDWLGLVLERLTGRSIDALLHERLFDPLGMRDTWCWIKDDAAALARTAAVHVRLADGGWLATDADYWSPGVRRPEFLPAGHCLYATAVNFLALQQLLLGGGQRGAVRMLPRDRVDALFTNGIGGLDVGRIPTADPAASAPMDLRGWKWSLGLLVNPIERAGLRSAWSAGWAGGFNTFYWVDRTRGVTAALYTATLPFYDPAVLDLYDRFERAVCAAHPVETDSNP